MRKRERKKKERKKEREREFVFLLIFTFQHENKGKRMHREILGPCQRTAKAEEHNGQDNTNCS